MVRTSWIESWWIDKCIRRKTRLTHERDDLYEGRVNPIASFPGQGVVVFGQKTLQSKPSALLDRVNVRRLLITVKEVHRKYFKILSVRTELTSFKKSFLKHRESLSRTSSV